MVETSPHTPRQYLEEETQDDFVLEDNQIICLLTGGVKSVSAKEETLQSLIRMMTEEYGFDPADMERDYKVEGKDEDDKKWSRKVELVIFDKGANHQQEKIIRVCVVQGDKTKETDRKNGVRAALENALAVCENGEFGLWTNGIIYHFLQRETDAFGNENYVDIADFPGEGETLEDLDRNDRSLMRNPAGDSLIRVFKRCHDYIYGNEGMKKTAFWELLNLIFCKLYDEKLRFITAENGDSYRRRFWVGVKEMYSDEGAAKVAKRIKSIFEKLKTDELFSEVFDGNEQINLTDKGLAFVASQLAKYSFLDASVDVKGTAYESIVSTTLKREAGQFFTPRNIIKCMVEMLDPNENHRILDPAAGSGGFLVVALDHVRKKLAKELFPDLSGPWLEEKYNSLEVNKRVKEFAECNLFGFDFDPDLKKAARMNMVMSGDGHANIFHVNSMAYPKGDKRYELDQIWKNMLASIEAKGDIAECEPWDDARGKFDLIFTNPPFGAKIPIDEPYILEQYDLGYSWKKDDLGRWIKEGRLQSSQPPEILFIEACHRFLKPGGRMAIVLPDGILGNPNAEYVRAWILQKFRILASIDLAVEAFLPQVGVQASLLFLQKKTELEIQIAREHSEDYDVFMAIAEKLGKDRRGNPIYMRDDDGAELTYEETVQYLVSKRDGTKELRARNEKNRRIDDDLPRIAAAYQQFLNGELK